MFEKEELDRILANKSFSEYLDMIKMPEIKSFTRKSIELYGDKEKLARANHVTHIVVEYLRKRKMLAGVQLQWVDLIISASLLHNLFYDGSLTSLFLAREKLTKVGKECKIPVNGLEPIFQAIEGQLGADMPVPGCQPNMDSPSGILANACWFAEELCGSKVIPDLEGDEP